MTVIAAVITEACAIVAADTRVVKSDGLVFPAAKLRRIRGGIAGAAGDDEAVQVFLDWMAATGGDLAARPHIRKSLEWEGMVVTQTTITEYGGRDPWPDQVRRPFHAIGSGAAGALAVMAYQALELLPLDPRAAVRAVCETNNGCGRPIDVRTIRGRRANVEG